MTQAAYPRRLSQPGLYPQPPPYALAIVQPCLPEKDARRVLNWQADVARETAAVQVESLNFPPPPLAPPPQFPQQFTQLSSRGPPGHTYDHINNSPPAASHAPAPSSTTPLSQRPETLSRSPRPGPNASLFEARTSSQSQPHFSRLVKRATISEQFRGDPPDFSLSRRPRFFNKRSSPVDDEYTRIPRSRSRGGEEVEVFPAQSGRLRSSGGRDKSRNRSGNRRNGSRERDGSRHRYARYILPTPPASVRGRNRPEERSHYTYPSLRPSKEERARSRSEVGRGSFLHDPIPMPMQRLTPPHAHRFPRSPSPPPRRYGESRSPRRRYDLSPSPPPTPRARRRSPPTPRAPQPPASYASHGSSGRRSSVTVKSPSAGVDYVISSEAGPPGLNLGVQGGVTTIRVIPRMEGSSIVDWEREKERERERAIERGLEIERERLGIFPHPAPPPAQAPHPAIGHVSETGRQRVLRKMAPGIRAEGLARSVAPSCVGTPANYATTIIPSDSISSVGSRKGERERLRDRMELDRWR